MSAAENVGTNPRHLPRQVNPKRLTIEIQVLIVEDEAIISMGLRYKLEAMGYSVIAEISSGKESVDAASRMRPDVVLMDIKLGGEMNDIDAATQIREQFDVPVVYLTACVGGDTIERAEPTEALGYLLKSFDDAKLRATVEMTIQLHKTGSGRTSQSPNHRLLPGRNRARRRRMGDPRAIGLMANLARPQQPQAP